MREAAKAEFYPILQKLETHFHDGMNQIIETHKLNVVVPHHGARFNILIGRETPALRYEDTFCHNNETFLKVLKACWEKGVYFHDYGGGPFHHGYSIQHSAEDINRVLGVLDEVLNTYRDEL